MRDPASDPDSKLDALLARLVEETITPEEVATLESMLDGNEGAQQRYFHYLGLHADMARVKVVPASSGRDSSSSTRRNFAVLRGFAAAAVLMTAAVVFLWPDPPATIATVSEFDGAIRWTGDSGAVVEDLEIGNRLIGGTLESLTADSWVEIEFLDGTMVSVSGHTVLTISEDDGQKILRLREGNLSIDATPQPLERPLRVITPSAEAEVLGTQFNVTSDAFSTRVAVNEGLVRVKRLADGSVQEISADQHVVAALEQETNFVPLPRKEYAETWASEMPRDVLQGEWVRGDGDLPGAVVARPHLWKGEHGKREPVLLYTAVLDPSAGELPPMRLVEGARFRVRGRLDLDHRVNFGFATHRARGGFSGKFFTWRDIEIEEGAGGRFEVELALEDFKPKKACFPKSPAGHEIVYLWIQTVEKDAGLEILSVELSR